MYLHTNLKVWYNYVLHLNRKVKKLGNSLDDADLHTVEDLTKSILAYGNVSKDICIITIYFNIHHVQG